MKQIKKYVGLFSEHEGVDQAKIEGWIRQFGKSDERLAIKLLSSIRYVAASQIREMTEQLVGKVVASVTTSSQKGVYFVPVGGAGDGSFFVARALKQLKHRTRAKWNVGMMADIERIPDDRIDVIAFVDDFSGTGRQLCDWWPVVEPLIRPKDASVVIALLVMNYRAQERLKKFFDRVLSVMKLQEQDNVLSKKSKQLKSNEKNRVLHYCRKTNGSSEYVRGYGNCGLLLAFKHCCPNNSLPILWKNSRSWMALFQRRGL